MITKKQILWLLSPFLSEDGKPSIKRFLALFFTYEIHKVIEARPWDVHTSYILIILGLNLGIMIGITTYQTLAYFFNINTKEAKDEKDSDKGE